MASFIIAEAGVNHNGRLDYAMQLVDVAAKAGADAVKFQTFRAERLVSSNAPKAHYQASRTGEGNQLAMLQELQLSDDEHRRLVGRCQQVGIEFMSTPFDAESAEMLLALGMKRIKVPSGELTNKRFIEFLARKHCPLVVSTGMATLEEVKEALGWIAVAREGSETSAPVTLLHCTSAYPAAPHDVNLRAMATLANETGCEVGYSDHTNGIEVATAAVALGATVIEKHFTLDRSLPGPDHLASLEPAELEAMVAAIRSVESCLGDGIKRPTIGELVMRDVARRSVVVVHDLPAGGCLSAGDLDILRPGTGIAPKHIDALIGRRLARPVAAGSPLQWSDLEA